MVSAVTLLNQIISNIFERSKNTTDIIKLFRLYTFICMLATAGQTAGPNWLTFFKETHEVSRRWHRRKKIDFSQTEWFFLFYGQRRALQLKDNKTLERIFVDILYLFLWKSRASPVKTKYIPEDIFAIWNKILKMLPTHNPPIISSKEMWRSNETLEITLKLDVQKIKRDQIIIFLNKRINKMYFD